MKTIKELYEKAGGSVKIAAALNLNQYTVDRWVSRGIPHWHWEDIMKFAKVSISDLHQINVAIQNKRSGKGK